MIPRCGSRYGYCTKTAFGGTAEPVLLFSIAPAWVELILSGRKTVELRRRPPKLTRQTPAIVYETSPMCRLRLTCHVGPVVTMPKDRLWEEFASTACVPKADFDSYFFGMSQGSAIHISAAEELPRYLTLGQLRKAIGFRPPQSWSAAPSSLLALLRTLE